jgi:hypothetical protein
LISGNGSVIETQTIYESEFILSLTQHSTGMYTILISKDNRTVSSFSIIKH